MAPSVRAAESRGALIRAAGPTLALPSRRCPPAPSVDAGETRAALVRSLYSRLDETEDAGDRAFVDRLLRALGRETLDLPLFPDVAHRLDGLIRRGEPSLHEVSALVRQEPDLVRRVWREANSATYARGVTSLDHAIARIGFDALWRIAMAACFTAPVFRVPGYERVVQRLRTTGLATAEVAAWLTDGHSGDAYLAGLLHEAGALVVYRAAVAPRGVPGPAPTTAIHTAQEIEASLGVLVGHSWKLSAAVIGAMGFHPAPERAPLEAQPCAATVRIARLAVHAVLDGQEGHGGAALAALQGTEDVLFDPDRTLRQAMQAVARAREG